MAEDLFHSLSPSKLRQEISVRVLKDQRALPERAKIFGAVSEMQGFDGWPGLLPVADVQKLIDAGEMELNRGICGTNGLPAFFYADQLVRGPLYPGLLTAFGHGIYLSTVSEHDPGTPPIPAFPRVSKSAARYSGQNETGVILRCSLKASAKILVQKDFDEFRRENRNRAREAQLTDYGSLAAALGYDAMECDKLRADQTETWYVVVNRTALTFQNTVLQRGHASEGRKS